MTSIKEAKAGGTASPGTSGRQTQPAVSARKRRILVVDDESSITRLLKLNLEQTNDYVVRTENSACQALATAEEFQPDLMLLDVMMPGMTGGELASRFQASPRLKSVPVIFLTAAATRKEVHARGGQIGGWPFLAKPVDLNEILRCLKNHLGD